MHFSVQHQWFCRDGHSQLAGWPKTEVRLQPPRFLHTQQQPEDSKWLLKHDCLEAKGLRACYTLIQANDTFLLDGQCRELQAICLDA